MEKSRDGHGTFRGMDVAKFLNAVELALSKGDRAEIVPMRDGSVKVIRVRRSGVEPKKEQNSETSP